MCTFCHLVPSNASTTALISNNGAKVISSDVGLLLSEYSFCDITSALARSPVKLRRSSVESIAFTITAPRKRAVHNV